MYDPMNVYKGRYKEFIENIISEGRTVDDDRYHHNHHIIPRCTFSDKSHEYINSEENKINLSYEDHFVAHQILAEENPKSRDLTCAFLVLSKKGTINKEEYAALKKQFSDSQLGNNYGLGNKGNYHKRSDEWCRNHSKSLTGKERGTLYYTHTCTICGKEYKGTGTKQKYCPDCKLEKQKLYDATVPKKYKLVCHSCHRDFSGRSSRQRYCDDCRYEKGLFK